MDAAPTPGLPVGTVLCDRYELVGPLWRDGAIHLYEARDRVLQRKVAVKLCHDGSPAERARFEAEVRWLAGSSGPGRVRIYDTGHLGEDQFAVVELQDILTAPDEVTAPVLIAPSTTAVGVGDLPGDATQVIGTPSGPQRHDTAVFALPLFGAVGDDEPPMPEAERRSRRGLFAAGAAAAAVAAVVLGLALSSGGSPDTTPVVGASGTSSSSTSSTSTTVAHRVAATTVAPTTSTAPPTTDTTVAPPTTSDGFPFDGSGPPGLQKKLADQG